MSRASAFLFSCSGGSAMIYRSTFFLVGARRTARKMSSASSCSFSGKILRVGGRVIEEKLFVFNPVLSFRSEKTLGDSQRGGSTARRDRSRQIWGCVQRTLQGAGGGSEGISSFSSVQSFLCLSYALKVSNPVRSRADYEAAQEGIIREVGTFCRCKHPSLVR